MRVLLVEDDPRIASDVARVLEAAGYLVETVRDGEEAWFRGDTEDYGAVVLDLGLPGMDGLAVLKRWRANGRRMPVLILTARGSWAERVDGIDAGADDYLPKPFRSEELLARLVELHPDREFELDATPDLPPVKGDPVLLARLFDNLLENARRYSSGRVEVRLRQGKQGLDAEVEGGVPVHDRHAAVLGLIAGASLGPGVLRNRDRSNG